MTTPRDARHHARRCYPLLGRAALLLVAGLIILTFCAGCPRRSRDIGEPTARADVRGGEVETRPASASPDARDATDPIRLLPPARGCCEPTGLHSATSASRT